MALTEFQKRVCRLLARHRIASGEFFHDSETALAETWDKDRELLGKDFQLVVHRERPSFVEASVSSGADSVLLQWATDSVYRFFPLVEHEELGLVLHPFDLATNTYQAPVCQQQDLSRRHKGVPVKVPKAR